MKNRFTHIHLCFDISGTLEMRDLKEPVGNLDATSTKLPERCFPVDPFLQDIVCIPNSSIYTHSRVSEIFLRIFPAGNEMTVEVVCVDARSPDGR
uniref:ZP domain-containing protein n=1 Tax=Heterorhabditis bacteriophora TaxID=37862 RepID=A0A1I7XVB0_HETBA